MLFRSIFMKLKSLLLSTLLVASAVYAAPSSTKAPKPTPITVDVTTVKTLGGVAEEAKTKVQLTVTKIEKKSRKITLKDKDGVETVFVAPAAVRNFAQIKVDDIVTTEQDVVISIVLLKNSGAATGTVASQVTERAKLGEKPFGVSVSTEKTRYNVTAVSAENQMVTLENNGATKDITVMDKVQFANIAVGDQVQVDKTVKIMMKVETPKK